MGRVRGKPSTVTGWAGLAGGVPEGFAVRVCVLEAHLLQLAAPIQLVMAGVSLLPQVLHVHADQHLPQLHEVTVVFVLNCRTGQGGGGYEQGRP